MNIYRINIKEEKEMTITKETIYDLTNKININETKYCPFCRYNVGELLVNISITCSPVKRIYSGIFFWRKYCTIEGIHDHFECKRCGIKWIIRYNDYLNYKKI